MNILNLLPPLSLLESNNLVSETLKKLTSLVEHGCEFYKICQQRKIYNEVDTQIKKEEINDNEFIQNNEELIDENVEKNNKNNAIEQQEKPTLKQMNTMQAVDEASNNLAQLINEYEKKEVETENIKKKLISQAKSKEEQAQKPKLPESHFKTKNKGNIEQKNRLNQILQIPAKKPEVESIIKLYLNKSGELKDNDGNNLMKTQKIIEEDIKKAKKNIQELTHKSQKMVWQEEREVFRFLKF